MREEQFLHFRFHFPSDDIYPWPSNLLRLLLLFRVMSPLYQKFIWLSGFEKIGEDGRTDGLNAAPCRERKVYEA